MPVLFRLSTAFSSSSSAPWTASRACCSRSRSEPLALGRWTAYSAIRSCSSRSGRSADSSAICATIGRTRGSSRFASSTVYVRSRCTASTILRSMEATEMRQRISSARVARLATADTHGTPHIVPITFAVDGDTIYFAVDAKPKRTTDLKRLRNIAANPEVAVLVDHYDEDWSRLWWVRIDGTARLLADGAQAVRATDLLAARYPQYRRARPGGPVVAISIDRISRWSPEAPS